MVIYIWSSAHEVLETEQPRVWINFRAVDDGENYGLGVIQTHVSPTNPTEYRKAPTSNSKACCYHVLLRMWWATWDRDDSARAKFDVFLGEVERSSGGSKQESPGRFLARSLRGLQLNMPTNTGIVRLGDQYSKHERRACGSNVQKLQIQRSLPP